MVGSVEVEGETFELVVPIRWWSRERLIDRFPSVQDGNSPIKEFHV